MTYKEFYDLFESEYRNWQTAIMANFEHIKHGDLLKLSKSRKHLLATDKACSYFSENQKWPLMEANVTWGCYERIGSARDFCRFISRPGDNFSKRVESKARELSNRYSDAEMIRWMLVDYWWHAGIWAGFYQKPE